LAAILALTLGEGGWGWLGLAIGVSLLIVLIAFFGFPGPGAKGRWGELTAFSAVASLCFVLVVAWPWQTIWANLNPSEKAVCAAVAEANEAKWIGDKDVTDGLPKALTRVRGGTTINDEFASTTNAQLVQNTYYENCLGARSFKSLGWWALGTFILILAGFAAATYRKRAPPAESL
jgi:hypothetical protein